MLYIIRGLPGSGKTTKAQCLLRDGLIDVYYEQDMYRITNDGRYVYDERDNIHVNAMCYNAVDKALHAGLRVAVCNTFLKYRYMEKYIGLARRRRAGYIVHTCRGEWTSVHDVPEHVMALMRKAWEDAPCP